MIFTFKKCIRYIGYISIFMLMNDIIYIKHSHEVGRVSISINAYTLNFWSSQSQVLVVLTITFI